jgi:hypothetical protein
MFGYVMDFREKNTALDGKLAAPIAAGRIDRNPLWIARYG